jgi:hypothetical protein
MVSETTLGVLFCFLLPVALIARYWNWYTYFKKEQQIKLVRQSQEHQEDD